MQEFLDLIAIISIEYVAFIVSLILIRNIVGSRYDSMLVVLGMISIITLCEFLVSMNFLLYGLKEGLL